MIRVRSKADPYQTRRMLFVTAWQGVEVRGACTVLHKFVCTRLWPGLADRNAGQVQTSERDNSRYSPHRAMYGPVCG